MAVVPVICPDTGLPVEARRVAVGKVRRKEANSASIGRMGAFSGNGGSGVERAALSTAAARAGGLSPCIGFTDIGSACGTGRIDWIDAIGSTDIGSARGKGSLSPRVDFIDIGIDIGSACGRGWMGSFSFTDIGSACGGDSMGSIAATEDRKSVV